MSRLIQVLRLKFWQRRLQEMCLSRRNLSRSYQMLCSGLIEQAFSTWSTLSKTSTTLWLILTKPYLSRFCFGFHYSTRWFTLSLVWLLWRLINTSKSMDSGTSRTRNVTRLLSLTSWKLNHWEFLRSALEFTLLKSSRTEKLTIGSLGTNSTKICLKTCLKQRCSCMRHSNWDWLSVALRRSPLVSESFSFKKELLSCCQLFYSNLRLGSKPTQDCAPWLNFWPFFSAGCSFTSWLHCHSLCFSKKIRLSGWKNSESRTMIGMSRLRSISIKLCTLSLEWSVCICYTSASFIASIIALKNEESGYKIKLKKLYQI